MNLKYLLKQNPMMINHRQVHHKLNPWYRAKYREEWMATLHHCTKKLGILLVILVIWIFCNCKLLVCESIKSISTYIVQVNSFSIVNICLAEFNLCCAAYIIEQIFLNCDSNVPVFFQQWVFPHDSRINKSEAKCWIYGTYCGANIKSLYRPVTWRLFWQTRRKIDH